MPFADFRLPKQKLLVQKPMVRVCYGLAPMVIASVYLFGLRSLVLGLVVLGCAFLAEALFTFPQNKPVTSAVFVTGLIYYLSLPPTMPFWMAGVGIVAGVALGKMVFGGFGQNVFNPAMVGRCFAYITFPIAMTNRWVEPVWGGLGGFARWLPSVDGVTGATPLVLLRHGEAVPWGDLFLGHVGGSLGETSALLILLGGAYILWKKAAPWRLAASCLLGAVLVSGVLWALGARGVPSPVATLLSGAFLFGCAFIATEPISGAKTKPGQWIYGFLIGGLIVVLRAYSNFREGVMFAVLIMNAFVPLIDQTVQQIQKRKKAQP